MVYINIEEIEEFLQKNDHILWKPMDFPEDMTEESTIRDLESEGNEMFFTLVQAKAYITRLVLAIKFMKTSIEDAKGIGDAGIMDDFIDEALKVFQNKDKH